MVPEKRSSVSGDTALLCKIDVFATWHQGDLERAATQNNDIEQHNVFHEE